MFSDFAGMSFLPVSTLTGTVWIPAGMHVGIFAFAGMTLVPLDIFSLAGSFTGSVDFVEFAGLLMLPPVPVSLLLLMRQSFFCHG